jgi:membrane fusion protein, multidrug efflux system
MAPQPGEKERPSRPIRELKPETRTTAASGRRWQWVVGFLILGLLAYLWSARSGSPGRVASGAAPMAGRGSVPVEAVQVRLGDLNRYLSAIGTVTAFNTVTVRSRVDGELIKVNFTEGQTVHQGELLAEIDPRPFQIQLQQAQGQLARDQAALKDASLDLDRDRILVSEGVLSRQQFDAQVSTTKQAQGSLVTDEANINNAKLQLTYSRITAPFTGRIGLRLVDAGNIVHATDTQGLAVITQLQPIAVLFSIPEDDLPKVLSDLKSGDSLPVDAYDRDLKNKLASGSLLTLDNQIDQSTGTIRLKASFPNTNNELFPNQFVNVRLLIDTLRNAVLIPTAAIQRGSQSSYVFVIRPGNAAEARTIKVGVLQGGLASIQAGVAPGEVVVTDGVDKLTTGSRVVVQMVSHQTGSSPGS